MNTATIAIAIGKLKISAFIIVLSNILNSISFDKIRIIKIIKPVVLLVNNNAIIKISKCFFDFLFLIINNSKKIEIFKNTWNTLLSQKID